MSGLLILMAVTVFMDEILPAPASPPAASISSAVLPAPKQKAPPTRLISSNTEMAAPQAGAEECKVGWGVDPSDNTMYMVIQIAPTAIGTFAAGARGQELQARIPPVVRNRIEKVIVRFGTGPVEQVPSESELVSSPLPKNSGAMIANLDRRSPVSIDAAPRSSEVVPTASTTQLPIVPNEVYPSASGSGTPTVPPPSAPAYAGTNSTNTTPFGTSTLGAPPSATDPRYAAPPPAWNNATTTRGTGLADDGFSPRNSAVPSTLNPFGSARTSTPFPSTSMPSTSGTAGNVTYGTNAYGATNPAATNPYGNSPYGMPTTGNTPYGSAYAGGAQVPPGGAWTGTNTSGNYAPQPYATNQPYAANTIAPPPLVASNPNGSSYPSGVADPILPDGARGYQPSPWGTNGSTLPSTSGSSRTYPTSASGSGLGGGASTSGSGSQTDPRDASSYSRGGLVPFFLILSFILNVYFGLWLNHLRTKYRHLLGTVRGISPLEMDRA